MTEVAKIKGKKHFSTIEKDEKDKVEKE